MTKTLFTSSTARSSVAVAHFCLVRPTLPVVKSARSIFLVLVSCALFTSCASEHYSYKMASDELLRQMFATTTTPIPSVRDIPAHVIKAAREITGDDFRLADRNQPYFATRVAAQAALREDKGLPHRQLQIATRSDRYVLLAYHTYGYYYLGGYAQRLCVLAFSITPKEKLAKPVLIARLWDWRVPRETVTDLAHAYERGKLQEYRLPSYDF